MLEVLGLSGLAETVYLAMLQFPEEGLDELVLWIGVGRDEVRAALDELTQISLLQLSTDPGRPRVVSPEVSLSVLVARKQAEVARHQQQIEESKAALAML